jgi:hypothetical protein
MDQQRETDDDNEERDPDEADRSPRNADQGLDHQIALQVVLGGPEGAALVLSSRT